MTPTNSDAEDIEIIGLMSTDDKWFERLYSKHRHAVNKLARSYYVVGGGDVGDLIQEAMIAFYNAARSYDPEKNASFRTYASVCVGNHLKDVIRKNLGAANALNRLSVSLSESEDEDARSEPPGYYSDPVTNFIREESENSFMRRMKGLLSDRQYKVLSLYLDGFGYNEIAEKLGIGAKSVDNALSAAKNKIRNYYIAEDDK